MKQMKHKYASSCIVTDNASPRSQRQLATLKKEFEKELEDQTEDRALCECLLKVNENIWKTVHKAKIHKRGLPYKYCKQIAEGRYHVKPKGFFDHTKYLTVTQKEHYGEDAKSYTVKCILTEPYNLDNESLQAILDFANEFNLRVYIGHKYPSLHFPNNTIPIVFFDYKTKKEIQGEKNE